MNLPKPWVFCLSFEFYCWSSAWVLRVFYLKFEFFLEFWIISYKLGEYGQFLCPFQIFFVNLSSKFAKTLSFEFFWYRYVWDVTVHKYLFATYVAALLSRPIKIQITRRYRMPDPCSPCCRKFSRAADCYYCGEVSLLADINLYDIKYKDNINSVHKLFRFEFCNPDPVAKTLLTQYKLAPFQLSIVWIFCVMKSFFI